MSSTNMDVDMDSSGGTVAQHELQEKIIKLHPLAIIGISDHHTRVSCGGSALPPSSPTIGLLWGQQAASPRPTSTPPGTNRNRAISIIDAEEVESGNPDASSTKNDGSSLTQEQMGHIQTKIELHQKVFPMHEVVGWYRVVVQPLEGKGSSEMGDTDADNNAYSLPTEQDLEINNGWMKTFLDNPIFILMDATERKRHDSNDHIGAGDGDGGERSDRKEKTDGEFAREKLDRDEELPLMLYESMGKKGSSSAFINLEFELETFEPERIAVEQVFKTRPKVLRDVSTKEKTLEGKETTASASASKKQAHDSKRKGQSQSQSQSKPEVQLTSTELHIQSVTTSVDALNARVAILLDFLRKTRDGEIEPNHRLLRQVMSLVKQLPLVMEKNAMEKGVSSTTTDDNHEHHGVGKEHEQQYGDMLVISYLATLAKTTKAVVGYSEKVHVLQEHATSSVSGFGRTEGRHQGRDLDFGNDMF